MGEVYEARHPSLGTPVALKVLRPPEELEGDPEESGRRSTVAELEARLAREAQLAARIRHPGVVPVQDLGTHEGRLFLVMEFVDGASLRDELRGGPVDVGRAVQWALQLLDILQAAHEVGVIHRDIKPDNVLVDRQGRIRLVDFGISKGYGDAATLTRAGDLLGTPEYMAPEQVLDGPEDVDARCDLHAVGVLLYELISGTSPFRGSNVFQSLKWVESLIPEPLANDHPGVSSGLNDVLMRAMAKEKSERYPDARSFADALTASTSHLEAPTQCSAPSSAAWRWSLGCLALVLAAVGGGWARDWWQGPVRDATPSAPAVSFAQTPAAIEWREVFERGSQRDPTGMELDGDSAFWRALVLRDRGELGVASEWLARDVESEVEKAVQRDAQAMTWLVRHTLLDRLRRAAPVERVGTADAWRAFKRRRTLDTEESFCVLAITDLLDERAQRVLDRLETEAAPSDDAVGDWHRGVLEAFARHDLGDDEGAAAALESPLQRWPSSVPLRALRLACDEAVESAAVRELAFSVDRRAPLRYRLLAVVQADEPDLRRLRAEAELAIASGAGTVGALEMMWSRWSLSRRGIAPLDDDALTACAVRLPRAPFDGRVVTAWCLVELLTGDQDLAATLRTWALDAASPPPWLLLWSAADTAGDRSLLRAVACARVGRGADALRHRDAWLRREAGEGPSFAQLLDAGLGDDPAGFALLRLPSVEEPLRESLTERWIDALSTSTDVRRVQRLATWAERAGVEESELAAFRSSDIPRP